MTHKCIFLVVELGNFSQEHLLAVTNSHEGNIFVDPQTTLNITEYVTKLFPKFGSAQAAGVATMYEGLGNNVDQASLAIGECAYVPSMYLPPDFDGSIQQYSSALLIFCLTHSQSKVGR
jgi:hypothetical protein